MDQKKLKTLLRYEPETGDFYWIRKPARRILIGARAGYISKGYMCIRIEHRIYFSHRLAWLFINGQWPVDEIDHIDGNPMNNKIANLRQATRAQNLANIRKTWSASGLRGVSWHKHTRKWRVHIQGKEIGRFATKEEAARIWQREAKRRFGEFAPMSVS